ncbi:uncharacterized protein LOC116661546 [Camelus ferus]|uniref:Uncharacterized protein LOC116661546 n=1 Tax=Camelus ferus TaxID=419612 RepID=A0A8B8SK42_CAMFR|nr:uncharacterized protein LOC116661546 [Camelus ferus]
MAELVLLCSAVQLQMQVQEALQERQEGARRLLLDPDRLHASASALGVQTTIRTINHPRPTGQWLAAWDHLDPSGGRRRGAHVQTDRRADAGTRPERVEAGGSRLLLDQLLEEEHGLGSGPPLDRGSAAAAEQSRGRWWGRAARGASRCTKQSHRKPLNYKDDNSEKHCAVTVNPWHMKKDCKVLNELRRFWVTSLYLQKYTPCGRCSVHRLRYCT